MRATRRAIVREVAAWVTTAVLIIMYWTAATVKDRRGDSIAPDLIVPTFVLGIVALVWAITETRVRRSTERAAILMPERISAPEPPTGGQQRAEQSGSWRADPTGRYELRYWDGDAWTARVSTAGRRFHDPTD